MDSPLEYDENTVKEFKIDKSAELEPEMKLGYVRTQLDEIKKAAYRVRVDLIIAQYQSETASNPNIQTQHQAKVNEQKLLLEQFNNSLVVLNKLVGELSDSISE